MKKIFVLLSLLFLFVNSIGAAGFYGNRSHLDYRTAQTRFFSLHYPKELGIYADQTAQLAESVADTLTRRYEVNMPRVDVVLEDALFSNGQANSARHALKLWVSDWGFKLRSTHPWLPDVVTHEFTHIVTLWAGAKTPPWLFGLHLGYQDYYNEALRTDWGLILSSGMASAWLAEGTAQYESARMGFDRWDSHRDMVMRMAVIEDQLIPIDLMNLFQSEKAIDFERGPYTQGFDLVRFIAQKWGDESVVKIWQALGSWANWSVASALKGVIGVDEEQLWQIWKQDRENKYREFAKSQTFVEGERMSAQGYYTASLRFAPNNEIWGFSNFGGPSWEGGLFAWENKVDSSKNRMADSLGRYSLGAYSLDSIELKKVWLDNGFDVRLDKENDLQIVTQAYGERDSDGQAHFNLFLYSASKGEGVYLTKNLDLRHPSFAPNKNKVVAVKKEKHRNRYLLGEFDLTTNEWVDLWSPDSMGIKSFQVFKPRYSPDGQKIVFTWYDQKIKRLSVYDVKTKKTETFLEGQGDHRDAIFSPDGKSILFSSDFDGIFNIYQLNPETKVIDRLTHVKGSAFEPLIKNDTLHYIGYDADGFNWYRLANPTPVVQKEEIESDNAKPVGFDTNLISKTPSEELLNQELELQENFSISSRAKTYRSIPRQVIVAPLFIGQEAPTNTRKNTEGESRYKAGVSFTVVDPVDRNTVDGVLLLEVGEGFDYINGNGINPAIQSDFTLGWTNKSTPVDLSLRYTRVNMRGQDTLKSEDPAVLPELTHYANLFQNIHTQVDYSVFKWGDRLSFGGGWQDIGFNLYESDSPLSYSVYQSFYGTIAMQVRRFDEDEGSAILTPGFGMGLWYRLEQSDLFRPNGKFSDSFEVNSAGVIKPIFTPYTVQTLHGDFLYATGIPFVGGVISLEAFGQSLLDWQANKVDTLDGFFLPGSQVVGYPYLDGEDVLFRGENTTRFSVRIQRQLYKLNKGFRAFHHVGAWLDFGFHYSTAFNDKFYQGTLNWVKSLHAELRFSNRIFYGIPMELFARTEWGLDQWKDYKPRGITGARAAPTRIQAGLVFRFDNPGELIDLRPTRRVW